MTIEAFKAKILEYDTDSFAYWGDLDPQVWGRFMAQTRDSDTLTESNFAVIFEDLSKRFPEDVQKENYRHWACGWIEWIRINTDNPELLAAAYAWFQALEDYGVADDAHYYDLQHEQFEAAYDAWARFDIASHCQSNPEDFSDFLDEDGDFAPTDDQSAFLQSWVVSELYDSGGDGIDLDVLADSYALYQQEQAREIERAAGQGVLAL